MSWTQTYTGNKFDPEKILDLVIDIRDIAHALSNLCRFAGHTPKFYSVAQHSVLVSSILKNEGESTMVQLQGLLHDAAEAYMVDLPQPIKRLSLMYHYREIEKCVESIIARRFCLLNICNDAVKRADLVCLATEARDLMDDPKDWESIKNVKPVSSKINPLDPQSAKVLFLERYLELTDGAKR